MRDPIFLSKGYLYLILCSLDSLRSTTMQHTFSHTQTWAPTLMEKDVGFGLQTVAGFADGQAQSMCARGGGGGAQVQMKIKKQHTSSIYCSNFLHVCGCVCISFHIAVTVNSISKCIFWSQNENN